MDMIKHTAVWADGDTLQGKLMLAGGILVLLACIQIVRGDNSILRGMLIPLGLLVLIAVGYGAFLSFARAGHVQKVSELYASQPNAAIQMEIEKAQRDHGNYSMIKKVWPVLIVVVSIFYFFVGSEYLKGLCIGLLILFVFGLLVDTFLHQRLEPYLEVLIQMNSKT